MFQKFLNSRIIPQMKLVNPSVFDVLTKNSRITLATAPAKSANVIRTFSHLSAVPKPSRLPLPKYVPKYTSNINQVRSAGSHGDHVRLWVIERIGSSALAILLPVAFIAEQPIVDALLAGLVVIHSHWGLEAIVLDYVRPSIVGPFVPKVAFLALNILSALTLAGLLMIIYNGPGLTKTIKKAWAIGQSKSI